MIYKIIKYNRLPAVFRMTSLSLKMLWIAKNYIDLTLSVMF